MISTKKLLESLIPLYFVYLAGGLLKGRTRLQKLTFLIQMKLKGYVDYEFHKDLYGPCSYRLYSIVDHLEALGLLERETHRTPSGNSVIHYKLTKNGRSLVAFALNKRKIPKRLRLKTQEIFSEYGSESIIDLVKRVYGEYPEWTEKSVFFSP